MDNYDRNSPTLPPSTVPAFLATAIPTSPLAPAYVDIDRSGPVDDEDDVLATVRRLLKGTMNEEKDIALALDDLTMDHADTVAVCSPRQFKSLRYGCIATADVEAWRRRLHAVDGPNYTVIPAQTQDGHWHAVVVCHRRGAANHVLLLDPCDIVATDDEQQQQHYLRQNEIKHNFLLLLEFFRQYLGEDLVGPPQIPPMGSPRPPPPTVQDSGLYMLGCVEQFLWDKEAVAASVRCPHTTDEQSVLLLRFVSPAWVRARLFEIQLPVIHDVCMLLAHFFLSFSISSPIYYMSNKNLGNVQGQRINAFGMECSFRPASPEGETAV